MVNVYLDGNPAEAETINPGTHIFVGTFRPPAPPHPQGASLVWCPCGRFLETMEGVRQHWHEGHFDTPAYRTL